MKKLVVLIPTLKMGGAQRSLIYFLTELDKTKIDVTLILFDKEGDLIDEIPDGINVLYFENYYDYFSKKYSNSFCLNIISSILKFDFKYLCRYLVSNIRYKLCGNIHEEQRIWFSVKPVIKKVKLEADFFISYMQGSATYFLVDKIITNGRKISVLNTDYTKAGYNIEFDKPYFDNLNNIICYTDEHNQKLSNSFNKLKNKIITIENITSINYLKNYASQDCLISKDPNIIKIVSVGRLEIEIKGYDLIIEVANLLSKKGYKFKWYILGDGSGRSWLDSKIKEYSLENVFILLGSVVNPYPYIKNASFVVQASRFEGKCRAIPESNILQTPIVCTEFAKDYPELSSGVNSYICKTDADSLYKCIQNLLKNPEEIDRLRNNIVPRTESGIKHYHDFFGI